MSYLNAPELKDFIQRRITLFARAQLINKEDWWIKGTSCWIRSRCFQHLAPVSNQLPKVWFSSTSWYVFLLEYVPDGYANQNQQISEMSLLLRHLLVFPPQKLLSPAAANLSRLSSLIQPSVGQAKHLSSWSELDSKRFKRGRSE